MAKSTRSKVKRHFRAKKRTEGVYAATEAARLHRLHMKLKALTTTEPEADEQGEEGEEGAQMETDGVAAPAGWYPTPNPFWLAGLGLVDPHDITPDSMADMMRLTAVGCAGSSSLPSTSQRRRNTVKKQSTKTHVAAAAMGDACGLDHLFPGLPMGSGAGISG
ncbi:hypothetical protein OH77DRAFT_1423539 [Trametes cingulata]|nr:hypothetical protein OH77DRAFT_1423539 [Trametes cingulata]